MKNKNVHFIIRIIGFALICMTISVSALAYPNGAPAGYTGSPGDGQNCSNCHGGTAVAVIGWITSTIPAQGYTAGTVYNITVTVSGTGAKGFEVSPQNVAGTQLGILAAGAGSQLVGGTKYVTQSAPGSTSATATWTFPWTAPAAGTGTVTFYGACIVGKPNTKLTTLVVNENVTLPLAVIATATPSSITSGQTSQLNATASGGSGTYTYSWTSLPAGFTSTLQNPVVSPTVTTQYIVTVNDGLGTAQGNVTVTVTAGTLSATASATPSVICVGQSSQLNVIPVGGSGTYTYSWTSVPAGFTSSIQNPVVTPIVATQYTAHVSDGTLSVNATTNVTVNQPATAVAGHDTTYAFTTTQVPLNGTATNFSTVLWTTSGTGTFSAANALAGNYFPSLADKTSGAVTLTLTASPVTPCTVVAVSSRIIHFSGPNGIADNQGAKVSVTISPNPSTGSFKLTVNGFDIGNATVTISDTRGRTVIEHALDAFGNHQEQIDMSGFPKGLYLMKIQTGKETCVRKLVIE